MNRILSCLLFCLLALACEAGVPYAFNLTNATLYVTTNGNDSYAIRGRSDLPFATVGAASLKSKPYDQILLGPGTFNEPTLVTISNNVSLRGGGKTVSHLTLSQGGPTNNPAGDALILSGNASMYDLHIIMTQAWSWVDCGDVVINDTNKIGNCWLQGNSDIFYLQQVDNAHQPGVIVENCDLESGWDFVLFNSQSLNTNGVFIAIKNCTLTESFSRFPYPWLYTTQSRGINLGLGTTTGYFVYQNDLISWLSPFGTNVSFISGTGVSNLISTVSGVTFDYKGTNLVVQNFPALRAFLSGTNGNTGFVSHNAMLSNSVSYVDENFNSLVSQTTYASQGFTGNSLTLTNAPAQITFGSTTNKIYSSSGSNDIKLASSANAADLDLSNQVFKVNVPTWFQSNYLSGGVAGTNQFYWSSSTFYGTNLDILFTNRSGASLRWNDNGLSGTNLTSTANFIYSDYFQTNFFVVSKFGIMHTNSQGFIIGCNDGMIWSNRLTGGFVYVTNNTLQVGGLLSAGTLNGTNGVNVAARNSIDGNNGHLLSYAYLTNQTYTTTNAGTTSAGVSIFVLDMTQPDITIVSPTNVNITGYKFITNSVKQEVDVEIKNTSATNYLVTWVAGTQIFGDFGDVLTSSCVVTNGKSALAHIKLKGLFSTNVTFQPMKN